MHIEKGASVAVVVRRTWVNLHAVWMFLRQNDNPQVEIRGVDDSHILFANVHDSDDANGFWSESAAGTQGAQAAGDRYRILIPWREVLTIVVADQFSPAVRQEARKIGFTGETEPE